jgi:hypothetical protein
MACSPHFYKTNGASETVIVFIDDQLSLAYGLTRALILVNILLQIFKYEAGGVLLAKYETYNIRSLLHPVGQFINQCPHPKEKDAPDINSLESYRLVIPASFLILSKQRTIPT